MKKASNTKVYYVFLGILVMLLILFSNAHTIFPIMDDDEYFIDENNIIHGNKCPYKSIPWFAQKHSKYDFIKETEQEICKKCLLFEEDKLMKLNEINLQGEKLRLRRAGASEEYINNKMLQHKSK